MHGWKWNGFKIQNEIKIPARGKRCNQNKVVASLLTSGHALEQRWEVAAGTLIKRSLGFLPSVSEGLHPHLQHDTEHAKYCLICKLPALPAPWNLSVTSKLTKSLAGGGL